MRHGRRWPIRIAMSVAVFRIVVVLWAVVIIRIMMFDLIPRLSRIVLVFCPQSDGIGHCKCIAYLVLVSCFRLSIPLRAGIAMCGSTAWVVL